MPAEAGASVREGQLDEDQYLNWKTDIIIDYRPKAFSLWAALGIILCGAWGGGQALWRLKI